VSDDVLGDSRCTLLLSTDSDATLSQPSTPVRFIGHNSQYRSKARSIMADLINFTYVVKEESRIREQQAYSKDGEEDSEIVPSKPQWDHVS
jgi:hypothetical protein